VTPARRIRLTGEVENRADADDCLRDPGDIVLVRRGPLRSAVIACPDGCGSVLTINLDPRAGKAWRAYSERRGFSLYPSVWREGGCGSHFVVWRNQILWCDRYLEGNSEPAYAHALADDLTQVLTSAWVSEEDLAQALDEIPWEVSRAARALALKGVAEAGVGDREGYFRLSATKGPESIAGPVKKVGFWRGLWRRLAG
jgi:hypothetical protein